MKTMAAASAESEGDSNARETTSTTSEQRAPLHVLTTGTAKKPGKPGRPRGCTYNQCCLFVLLLLHVMISIA